MQTDASLTSVQNLNDLALNVKNKGIDAAFDNTPLKKLDRFGVRDATKLAFNAPNMLL